MAKYSFTKLEEVESTNSYVLKNLSSLPDKHVVIASRQTSGRGRLQRKWISNVEGNLYMTILLKPFLEIKPDTPLVNLTQYMSVVLCKVLEGYNITPSIKWPNDVLVEGRKIAGILSETSIQGSSLKGLALGVGVNLNSSNKDIEQIDQPATSLNLLIRDTIDVNKFTEMLANEFFNGYESFMLKGFTSIKTEYINRSNFLGKEVTVNNHNESISCLAQNINDDGTLLVKNNKNEESKVTIGDIICF